MLETTQAANMECLSRLELQLCLALKSRVTCLCKPDESSLSLEVDEKDDAIGFLMVAERNLCLLVRICRIIPARKIYIRRCGELIFEIPVGRFKKTREYRDFVKSL
jgi:hypothetical protein